MKIIMNLDLARACAKDEGDINMRKNGRKSWNEDDWNKALETLDRLWPINPELLETI